MLITHLHKGIPTAHIGKPRITFSNSFIFKDSKLLFWILLRPPSLCNNPDQRRKKAHRRLVSGKTDVHGFKRGYTRCSLTCLNREPSSSGLSAWQCWCRGAETSGNSGVAIKTPVALCRLNVVFEVCLPPQGELSF